MRSALSIAATPAVVALIMVAPAAARADDVIDRIIADSARAPMVGFERTTRATRSGKTTVQVDRFDPSAPAGSQWTLLSIDGRAPTGKDVAAHRKAASAQPVPGYHRLAQVVGGKPVKRTDSAGRSVYRWDGLPSGAVPTPGPDISKNMSAEAVVDTAGDRPELVQMRIFAAKPFSIMGVAKMNAFDVISHYQPVQNGVPFLTTQTLASDVSAPFGKGGKTSTTFSFRPL